MSAAIWLMLACLRTTQLWLLLTPVLVPAAGFATSIDGAENTLTQARDYLRSGDLMRAETKAREYLAQNKQSADGHTLLGQILFKKANARASLAEYTEAARYRKPDALDLIVVGSDYVLLNDFADADKWFTQATEWDPGNIQAWYYLGRTKYNENRFDEAVQLFRHTLQLAPRNVKAEDNLGLSLQALQRLDEAKDAFRTAMDWQGQNPFDAGPFVDMGSLLLEQGHPGEALAYLRKAVALASNDARAHQQLGKAYLGLSRLDEARSELEHARELNPENAPLHYMLGQLYRREGLDEKAKREFERYTALSGAHSASEPLGTMSPAPH